MIVKLWQIFRKMREFSQIRDPKKIMVKIIIVYEIRLCSQMGTLAVFSTNCWNQFKVVYYHTKQSEQPTYAGSWYNSQHMAAFRLRKRTLHFMHIIQVFFWYTLHLPLVVDSRKCPTPSCLTSAGASGTLTWGRSALADSIKPVA